MAVPVVNPFLPLFLPDDLPSSAVSPWLPVKDDGTGLGIDPDGNIIILHYIPQSTP
jgi:hypothetical protein